MVVKIVFLNKPDRKPKEKAISKINAMVRRVKVYPGDSLALAKIKLAEIIQAMSYVVFKYHFTCIDYQKGVEYLRINLYKDMQRSPCRHLYKIAAGILH